MRVPGAISSRLTETPYSRADRCAGAEALRGQSGAWAGTKELFARSTRTKEFGLIFRSWLVDERGFRSQPSADPLAAAGMVGGAIPTPAAVEGDAEILGADRQRSSRARLPRVQRKRHGTAFLPRPVTMWQAVEGLRQG